ncbi:MAG: DUF1080 domain-containing protein [Candidatus Hydrogenedens sp.]|nr:DUF1080 domain-containing protein [Candidatus Hydrogenedens sp.]
MHTIRFMLCGVVAAFLLTACQTTPKTSECATACETPCASACETKCQEPCESKCEKKCEEKCEKACESKCESAPKCEEKCDAASECEHKCEEKDCKKCQHVCDAACKEKCEAASKCEHECESKCDAASKCEAKCEDKGAAACSSKATCDAPSKCEAMCEAGWTPLLTCDSLDDWTVRGGAKWRVENGVLIGQSEEGNGHLYAAPVLSDLEVKGTFRISSQGRDANSGLYFRANPSEDNPEGFPRGYEAQMCHTQDAFTGWLWKPGTPTGEASKLLTKDDEWFTMRVKAVGSEITIWVNDVDVMHYQDDEYKTGHFALQCHNPGMTIEAKDLYYRDLSKH